MTITLSLVVLLQTVVLSSAFSPCATSKLKPVQKISDPAVLCSSKESELESRLESEENDGNAIFEILADSIAQCLVLSDIKRHTGNDGASTGWTSWVDEGSSFRLQSCINKIGLVNPMASHIDPSRIDLLEERDESQRWIRWMKNSPSPLVVELSQELQNVVNGTVTDRTIEVSASALMIVTRELPLLFINLRGFARGF